MKRAQPEEWRSIPGWIGVYEVSSFGNIRRCQGPYKKHADGMLTPVLDRKGYRCANLTRLGLRYSGHVSRLVIAAFYSDLPPKWQADHINGDRGDDRLENLRPVPPSENAKNRGLNKNSVTKAKGVRRHKQTQKFVARIQVNGRRIHLGEYETVELAAHAYNAAETLYFGEMARAKEHR